MTFAANLSHIGRTVIVSGGTRGIGRALVEGFLDAGARVVAFHRGESPESQVAEAALRDDLRIPISEAKLLIRRLDLTDSRACRDLLRETVETFGHLDVLINNAGVCYRDNLTPARLREQRLINATAPLRFSREAVEWMRGNTHVSDATPTRGSILSLSSYVTEWKAYASEYLAHYARSKRLLERGMKRLALELRPVDINVNVIAVGVVYAGMGLATIGRKEDALRAGQLPVTKFADVDAVVFEALCLTHPRAHYKTGRVEVLDGGWNLGADTEGKSV